MDGIGEFGAVGAADNLTRADGLTSQTTSPVDKTAPTAVVEQFKHSALGTFDYTGHITERFGTAAPNSRQSNGLARSSL